MNATPGAEFLQAFERGLRAFERTSFALDPREDLEGTHCNVTAVYRGGDVVFHLFPKGRRASLLGADARSLLADLIEVYFGGTERFSADYSSELESWAIRAEKITEAPSYSRPHHVHGFAQYVNQALADL